MPAQPPGDVAARSARQGRGTTAGLVIRNLVVVGLIVIIGLCLAGFWVYANHDRPELIDRPEVSEVVESSCASMQAAVAAKAAPSDAAINAKVRSIGEQNAAVAAMVAQVRGLGSDLLEDDLPTVAWLSDWESLIAAREQYVRDLSTGRKPRFVVPTADGFPVTNRMDQVGLACQVPPQLLNLQ
jgi:hypothetical protein